MKRALLLFVGRDARRAITVLRTTFGAERSSVDWDQAVARALAPGRSEQDPFELDVDLHRVVQPERHHAPRRLPNVVVAGVAFAAGAALVAVTLVGGSDPGEVTSPATLPGSTTTIEAVPVNTSAPPDSTSTTSTTSSTTTTLAPVEVAAENVALPAGSTSAVSAAFDGSFLWVVNQNSNDVSRVDPATLDVTNFPLPDGAALPDSIVFDGTSLWVANYQTSNLTRIDPTTGAAQNVALPAGAFVPIGLAFDGRYVWVSNNFSANVSRIDPATGEGINVALPGGAQQPYGIVVAGTDVWVVNRGSNSVTRVDTTTLEGMTLALPSGASAPQGIAYDGTYVWTVNTESGDLSRVSAADPTDIVEVALPADVGRPIGATTFLGFLWVTSTANVVTQVDASTGETIVHALTAGADNAVSIVPAAGALWTTNFGSSNLTRLTIR